MAYEIKHQSGDYHIVDSVSKLTLTICRSVDEANRVCWLNKEPTVRFQIVANAWSARCELTWYEELDDGTIIPNGYETIEEARLAIVEDLQELCLNNDYEHHPNPHGDYSIIDTFTGEEVDYEISDEEARHPDPTFVQPCTCK